MNRKIQLGSLRSLHAAKSVPYAYPCLPINCY